MPKLVKFLLEEGIFEIDEHIQLELKTIKKNSKLLLIFFLNILKEFQDIAFIQG